MIAGESWKASRRPPDGSRALESRCGCERSPEEEREKPRRREPCLRFVIRLFCVIKPRFLARHPWLPRPSFPEPWTLLHIPWKMPPILEPKVEVIRLRILKHTCVCHITCFLEHPPDVQMWWHDKILNLQNFFFSGSQEDIQTLTVYGIWSHHFSWGASYMKSWEANA